MSNKFVERAHRISDLLCSAHSAQRDRFRSRALLLDLLILATTTWLTAMVFVDSKIGVRLTPFTWDKELWIGILAILAFFLSLIQMKLDWKAIAEAHARAVRLYFSVKIECSRLLDQERQLTEEEILRVREHYSFACENAIEIRDKEFLKLKKHHSRKVALSKYLDTHPNASIWFIMIKWWWRDNVSER